MRLIIGQVVTPETSILRLYRRGLNENKFIAYVDLLKMKRMAYRYRDHVGFYWQLILVVFSFSLIGMAFLWKWDIIEYL